MLFDRFIFPGYKKSRCSKLKGLFYSYSSLLFVCLLQISCLVNITAVNNLTRKSPCIVSERLSFPLSTDGMPWRCTHVPPRRPRLYLFSSHTKPDLFSFLIFARLLLPTANWHFLTGGLVVGCISTFSQSKYDRTKPHFFIHSFQLDMSGHVPTVKCHPAVNWLSCHLVSLSIRQVEKLLNEIQFAQ